MKRLLWAAVSAGLAIGLSTGAPAQAPRPVLRELSQDGAGGGALAV